MFLREKLQRMSDAGVSSQQRYAFSNAYMEGVRRGMNTAKAMEYAEETYAELTTNKRKNLKDESFAIPEERKFPIHDRAHAANAKARAAGTKYEKRVDAAVGKKFPDLAKSKEK